MVKKIIYVNGAAITDGDVKKMSISEIQELELEIDHSLHLATEKKAASLKKNKYANVSAFSHFINKVAEAKMWIGAIKKEKKLEANLEIQTNRKFVEIAKTTLKEKDFKSIYERAVNEIR
jgi:hypothetical protein